MASQVTISIKCQEMASQVTISIKRQEMAIQAAVSIRAKRWRRTRQCTPSAPTDGVTSCSPRPTATTTTGLRFKDSPTRLPWRPTDGIPTHPEESRAVFGHEGVRFRLVLVVQGVEVEVLLVAQEALAHQEREVVAALQLPQEVVVVEPVNLLDVAEDDVALPPQRLRYVLAGQLRNVILFKQSRIPHSISHPARPPPPPQSINQSIFTSMMYWSERTKSRSVWIISRITSSSVLPKKMCEMLNGIQMGRDRVGIGNRIKTGSTFEI